MAQSQLKNDRFQNDEVDIRERSLYARLKRLFSSGTIVRNIGGKKLKVIDTDNTMVATSQNTGRDRFNRVRSTGYNAYTRDFALSYQAARIDLFRDYDCVGPDTVIPLPDGTNPTIAELAEKYKNKPQERFWVFSYDHETDSIKLGKAYHPRKKGGGTREGFKVTFDNGQYVIGSIKHPFLMRDGTYKKILELKIGDSVMPFYQKPYNKGRYRKLYNFSKGWQTEHRIVAEQFYGPLNKNECVHHKNFKGLDNLPENLQVMTKIDHYKYHSNHSKNVLWGPDNYENQLKKLLTNENYINRKFHIWGGKRVGKNNPFHGKIHRKESNEKRSKTLKEVLKNRDQCGDKNPRFRDDLTIEALKVKASDYYKENEKLTLWELINYVGCDYSTFQNRLQSNNISWSDFKEEAISKLNHKIVSIEHVGPLEVYDVTVEKYHNFATDNCYVSNTMDMDPIISSALDIYSDECLTPNEMGEILVIHSDDNNIKDVLYNLFYDILNVRFNLWSWTRNMAKYGDFFLRLYISPTYGVYFAEPISAYNVERIENSDPLNKNYVKFQIRPTDTSQAETLEEFEMVHFRLLADSNFLPYGKGMMEGARRIWKQLSLMEDAMLIHRIMRAPEKRIFKVDIGNIPPNEVDSHMEKLISKMKKVPYLDQRTGDYNLRFNLQNMVEDFFLPVRGSDSGNSIENLTGMEWTGTDDIEYLRNKLMAGLKIPKAFLGYEEELSGKATLAAEDVRFARTIGRVQNFLISALGQIARVHLYSQGYRDEELVNFSIELTNPSIIFEKEKVALWTDKVDVAKNMMENKLFSKRWVYNHLFDISEEDIELLNKEIIEDAKQLYRYKSIEEDGNDPAQPFKKIKPPGEQGGEGGGEGGPGGGPDLGDLEGGPGGGPGGELGGEPGAGGGSPEADLAAALKEVHGEHADDYVRPSQEGDKDATKYPFGEDPLGDKENNEQPRKGSDLIHKWKSGSPFDVGSISENKKNRVQIQAQKTLRDSVITSMRAFMDASPKEILTENTSKTEVIPEVIEESDTFLNEDNIIDS
jgi:hypothetical protein